MAASMIFVHGITVREDRFARLLTSVRWGLFFARAHVTVKGCYWGDIAAIDEFRGRSIPAYGHGARGLDDPAVSSWLEDPLGGLRQLRDAGELEPLHGLAPVPEPVRLRNTALAAAQPAIIERLSAVLPNVLGPNQFLPDHTLPPLTRDVLEVAEKADRTLTAAALSHDIAEALVAAVFIEAASGRTIGIDTEFRWTVAYETVVGVLAEHFGTERGMRDIGAKALTAGLRWGGRKAAMSALAIGIGDVLVHASHREQILERLDQQVRQVPDDHQLVIVGHSLGGVIAFEYCRTASRPVQRLVTVGSQVGLFGELGVYGRERDETTGRLRQGAGTDTWINMYDPADALGFLAAPVFPGVTDIEVITGAPFPICHSEYWNRTETYHYLYEAP